MSDQAEPLRQLMDNEFEKQAEKLIQWKQDKRILTFVSGKVGLGYSTILANLAIALTQVESSGATSTADQVLIIESREFHEHDNVDEIYNIIGAIPKYDFTQVLSNEIPLEDAIVTNTNGNVSIVVAGSRNMEVGRANFPRTSVTENIEKLCSLFDFFIVDAGPIYASESIEVASLTHELITIVTPSNDSIKHCYTMLKSIVEYRENKRRSERLELPEIGLITNLVTNEKQAKKASNGMILTAQKFLNTDIDILGSIPIDINVIEATREYAPFVNLYPKVPASAAVNAIAKTLKDKNENITTKGLRNILTKLFT